VIDQGVGWRLAFGLGAVFVVGILWVRRAVPESPRWLFIHGHEDEASEVVAGIEAKVSGETHVALAQPEESITIEQRRTIGLLVPEMSGTPAVANGR
jgi:MFS family permease